MYTVGTGALCEGNQYYWKVCDEYFPGENRLKKSTTVQNCFLALAELLG
jgi:hypothetical protein